MSTGELAASRVKHYPGATGSAATLIFPHAGGAAVGYHLPAQAFTAIGDVYVMRYPGRAERGHEPPALTLPALAGDLFEARDWSRREPVRLFGHSMGALVAFEFAKIAQARGVGIRGLWASAGPAPAVVAEMPALPMTDAEILADITRWGGTAQALLDDDEFAALILSAVRQDYHAINRYRLTAPFRLGCAIHVIGAADDDRVGHPQLARWREHTDGPFTFSQTPGGHFYLDQHAESVVALVAEQDVAR
jgi:surfactin synthase thioesterase subunit